ncbi:unnamed protein product [Symbiodinium microadriaticum]|nr:unnamed protein product [Symbiodinium microadriaticum]
MRLVALGRLVPKAEGLLRTMLRSAVVSRAQELHRHRKRLDGFGKDAPRGDAKTLGACRELLKDEDWFARKTAVDTLKQVAGRGEENHLALLYKHLEDEDIFVREAAVDAVAEVAEPEDVVAVSKVSLRLADEDCFVRARAVVALGRLGHKGDARTLALLEDMFEDGFVPVRKRALEAVEALAPVSESLLNRLRPVQTGYPSFSCLATVQKEITAHTHLLHHSRCYFASL